jgi:hypothetical protein
LRISSHFVPIENSKLVKPVSVTLLPQHGHDWRAVGQDQVRRHAQQLGRVGAQYLRIPCPAVFDFDVVSFDPTQLP